MNAKLSRGLGIVLKGLAALLVLLAILAGTGYYAARVGFFRIYDVPPQYMIGAPGADLTIVEFLDYGCQKCRDMHPDFMEAVRRDASVRVAPRPLYLGDPWRKQVILAVYAAGEQGKFAEMHAAVMKNWPIANERALFEIAAGLGLDVDRLARDTGRADLEKMVQDTQAFFERWHFNYMPSLLMGRTAVFRPRTEIPTTEGWLQRFDDARAGR